MQARTRCVVLGALAMLPLMGLAQGGGESGARTGAGDPRVVREFAGVRAFTKPSRDAQMGFSLPTQVMELFVKGGQDVKKGEKLVRGDDAEERALLKIQRLSAESDLAVRHAAVSRDLAQLEYARVMEMRGKGGSNQQEEDRARLSAEAERINYETAKFKQDQEVVSLERMEARVARLVLTAPFDGQVDTVEVDAGQTVSERDKVVRVVNVDPLWIDVPAPMWDPATASLREGERAWVLVEKAGKPLVREGKIIEVSPVSDPGSRTRRVRVEMPNPREDRVVSGEPAWVRFSPPPDGVARLIAEAGASAEPVVRGGESSRREVVGARK